LSSKFLAPGFWFLAGFAGVYLSMIRKYGFRSVLPVLLALIQLSLSLRQHPTKADSASKSSRETVQWEPLTDLPPKPLSADHKAALILNLPALILAAPLTVWLFPEHDLYLLYVSVPFVAFLWYAIGRWLDRRCGYVPRRHLLPLLLHWLLLLGWGVALTSLTPGFQHRTGDTDWIAACLIFWSCVFGVIDTSAIVDGRRLRT
jgi:hypothetical protein